MFLLWKSKSTGGFMDYSVSLDEYWTVNKKDTVMAPVIAGASVVDQRTGLAYLYGGMAEGGLLPCGLYAMDLDNLEIQHLYDLDTPGRMNHQMFLTEKGRLLILGGVRQGVICNEILELDPRKGLLRQHSFKEESLFAMQQTAFYQAPYLYVYGGFVQGGRNTDRFFRIHSESFVVEDLSPAGKDARAGMISQVLPENKAFIFSGFSYGDEGPDCHNNYYLYDIKQNLMEKRKCNEVCGRSFAKSFLLPDRKKVIIALGTINGLETSGAFYHYDWEQDRMNRLFIQTLPVERVEPMVFYSEKNRQCHILGGAIPGPEMNPLKEHVILDFNQVPDNAWEFH